MGWADVIWGAVTSAHHKSKWFLQKLGIVFFGHFHFFIENKKKDGSFFIVKDLLV